MREWKSQSHVKMVLQISHCVQPKVPKEGDVRKFEKGGREDPPGAVQPVGSRIGGGTCDVGPCSPVSEYSTEVQRGQHGRVSEGQICDTKSIVNTWGGRGTSRGSIFGHAVTVLARWV